MAVILGSVVTLIFSLISVISYFFKRILNKIEEEIDAMKSDIKISLEKSNNIEKNYLRRFDDMGKLFRDSKHETINRMQALVFEQGEKTSKIAQEFNEKIYNYFENVQTIGECALHKSEISEMRRELIMMIAEMGKELKQEIKEIKK